MSDGDVSEMSFEQAMRELEKVVGQLESGDVELEASIKLYERGAQLRAHAPRSIRTLTCAAVLSASASRS